MRKLLVVPLAGLLVLGIAAPALAGPNTTNLSGSATIAQASWESYDDATETYAYGYLVVVRESGSTAPFAQYQQYTEQIVQCTGDATPDDPSDDTFAPKATFLDGFGDATLAIGKSYSSAAASGNLAISSGGFDGCTGEKFYEEAPGRAFTLDLTATSPTIRESGRGSFHVPGEFNNHSSYKATYRLADAAITGLDAPAVVSGQIGKVSWMDHTNG
jgi:hypothetical protein